MAPCITRDMCRGVVLEVISMCASRALPARDCVDSLPYVKLHCETCYVNNVSSIAAGSASGMGFANFKRCLQWSLV